MSFDGIFVTAEETEDGIGVPSFNPFGFIPSVSLFLDFAIKSVGLISLHQFVKWFLNPHIPFYIKSLYNYLPPRMIYNI